VHPLEKACFPEVLILSEELRRLGDRARHARQHAIKVFHDLAGFVTLEIARS
jgi:hypothetical protein